MPKVNLYYVEYNNGHIISHYDNAELIKMISDYNALHNPSVNINIHKINRYTSGKCRIPKPYKYFTKIRLNEMIGIKNLARVDYDKQFKLLTE